ncbi:hypothetical protein GQ457_02G017080 [Hibiscus cannabinus]
MHSPDRCLFIESIRVSHQLNLDRPFLQGGLFLYDKTVPPSFISSISLKTQRCFVDKNDNVCWVSCDSGGRKIGQTLCPVKSRRGGGKGDWFLSVSLSREEGYVGESDEDWGRTGDKNLEALEIVEEEKEKKGSGSAVKIITFLDYGMWNCCPDKNIATQFCMCQLQIRTVMIAPGGEALGVLIGAFRHMIQTEGFFSLYKGLVPSIISMAPSGAVFYGIYDILKSGYLRSPEGRKRIQDMKQGGQELNAFEQLELGPVRTLLYGAIAGACSEAATYPFEVVRRHLQMQVRATKLSALATCVKIVQEGETIAYILCVCVCVCVFNAILNHPDCTNSSQVLPSAAISYLVCEFMKIVLKVEPAWTYFGSGDFVVD